MLIAAIIESALIEYALIEILMSCTKLSDAAIEVVIFILDGRNRWSD
jgi:hypothetical protein